METLSFFEEFRELSQGSSFADPELDADAVELTNPVCGDLVRVKIEIDGGRVSYYGYQQKGCWPVAGCLELLGQLCAGGSLEQVLELTFDRFLCLVEGVPASKRHAFSLAHRATLMALGQALTRQDQGRNSGPEWVTKGQANHACQPPRTIEPENSGFPDASGKEKGYTRKR